MLCHYRSDRKLSLDEIQRIEGFARKGEGGSQDISKENPQYAIPIVLPSSTSTIASYRLLSHRIP
jgi:hypothetical protein